MAEGLVIVGGSYAALHMAQGARENGYGEAIRLISDEPWLPYQRPPLSKGFLAGKIERDALALKGEAFYRDNGIEVLLETRVSAIDRQARTVTTAAGANLRYDGLGLALGARPRLLKIAGADLDGVFYLRSLADTLALRERLARPLSIVVIGGGFIGLEVAASLATLGHRVSVVEALERLMARVLPPVLSDFMAQMHRGRGVEVRLSAGVQEIKGDGAGRVASVLCSDGSELAADIVVAGIGVVPETGLAAAAGLACRDGILVDDAARTADPAIVAAGDCVRYPSAFTPDPCRLESVQNASDQGRAAGAALAGKPQAYRAVPWFWSDQYECKLQMAGLSPGHDRLALRGAMAGGRFSLFYFRAGRLVAVDTVNRPGEHLLGRKLLAAGASLTPEQAADESFDLKALLAA